LEITASPRTIELLTTRAKKYEQDGYIGARDKTLHRATMAALRGRKHKIRFKETGKLIKGSPEEKANVLAITAAYEDEPEDIDLTVPARMRLTGASLMNMTQTKAYKEIKRRKKNKELTSRTRTWDNLEKAKDEMEDACGHRPQDRQIWKSQKCRDLSKKQQAFIWMVTHDAYTVGTHWLRDSYKDELKERAECKHCGETETLQHIFTRCESPGRELVWVLAKQLWQGKGFDWPWPGLGMMIAAGAAKFVREGQRDKGAGRLYQLLIIESAYLIWLLRNERVIQNEGAPHTEEEIRNRWINAINARLKLDCELTCKKYGKKGHTGQHSPRNMEGNSEGRGNSPRGLDRDWGFSGVSNRGSMEDALEGDAAKADRLCHGVPH
ncbi:hypothetical protein C8F01DRAFT_1008483, partial [Mycena amicta]